MSGRNFVLVHGAWHGGWCWQRVADILHARGCRVFAPTLTGLCERVHLASPTINLTTHILDLVNEVTWKELDDIVLCGHSYGGMVITGALERIHERIAAIVYVDAFLPTDGQSLNDIVGASRPASDGMVAPITAEEFSVNPSDRRWVNGRCTPQSAACFSEKLLLTGVLNQIRTKVYVGAEIGTLPVFQSTYDRLSGDSTWQTYRVAAGHNIMLDKPAELAEILLSVT